MSIDTTLLWELGLLILQGLLRLSNRILALGIYGSYNGYSKLLNYFNGSPDTSFVTGTGFMTQLQECWLE
jgi:hypothetical protein